MLYNPLENNFNISADEKSILPQVIWHITEKCKLNCKFCFASKANSEFNMDLLENYKTVFKSLGIQKIDISGGEPLLFRKLPVLIESLIPLNIHLTITTSASGNFKNTLWLLSNKNLFTRIIVSVDSHLPEYHDKLRGKKGIFSETITLIKDLTNSYGNVRVNSVITPFYENKLEIERFVETINKLGIKEWCLIQPSKANEKINFKKYYVNNATFDVIFNTFEKHMKIQSSKVKLIKRYAENYSGYWVLYPNNKMIKHNEEDDLKDLKVEFDNKNLESIINIVKNNSIWLPIK
jgi:MoaA/NifB/PqqE/SkfB family radical SAM enzyme